MKFMQTAREEEQRKQLEKAQLRHLEDMQWVIPGFEDEVAEAEDDKLAEPITSAAPATLLLFRRSYKGHNKFVEQCMKNQIKQHAEASRSAEELLQATELRAMKQR